MNAIIAEMKKVNTFSKLAVFNWCICCKTEHINELIEAITPNATIKRMYVFVFIFLRVLINY